MKLVIGMAYNYNLNSSSWDANINCIASCLLKLITLMLFFYIGVTLIF